MAHESDWRRESRNVIDRALREGREQGLAGSQLLAHVDASYPFGERAHYPYKVWLDQRKRQCGSLLPPSNRRRLPSADEERLARLEDDMRRVASGEVDRA